MIKKVKLEDDFQVFSKLLNESFQTVAEEFGLTRENAPTNNAFITSHELKLQFVPNREFFYLEEQGIEIGFKETLIKSYDHLPFEVCMMEVTLKNKHECKYRTNCTIGFCGIDKLIQRIRIV